MGPTSGWRCPVCGAVVPSAAEHLRSEHGMGSGEDRFGLRKTVRPAPAPRPRRLPARRRPIDTEQTIAPARPMPLPPGAGLLRLVCETLDGADVAQLQARLADLPGVESVAIELYERTVDLFLDSRRAVPTHLVTLAAERVGLPVRSAELHRRPANGTKLGDETRLMVLV